MVKAVLLCLSILSATFSFAQDTAVNYTLEELAPYMEGFISLESDSLPNVVRKNIKIISQYMKDHDMEMSEYYTTASSVYSDNTLLILSLYHVDGFVKKKWIDDEMKRLNKDKGPEDPKVVIAVSGNLSGKDGMLEIDLRKKRVTSFTSWE